MVDLVRLKDFARKYFYTKTEEYNDIGYHLTRIGYDNGELELYESSVSNFINQSLEITFSNLELETITLDFNYLPLEQNVTIKVNGNNYSEYTRIEDSITLNLRKTLVNSLSITVDRYIDEDTGIVYKGLIETKKYKPLFDVNPDILKLYFVDNNSQWILEYNTSVRNDDLIHMYRYLEVASVLDGYHVSLILRDLNKLIVDSPFGDETLWVRMPVKLIFSRQEDDEYVYYPIICTKSSNEKTFNIQLL